MVYLLVFLLATAQLIHALHGPRQSESEPKPFAKADIDRFTPWTKYAALAYCNFEQLRILNKNHELSESFELKASGGNARSVRYWFVGYDKELKMAIVAHGGAGAGGQYVC